MDAKSFGKGIEKHKKLIGRGPENARGHDRDPITEDTTIA